MAVRLVGNGLGMITTAPQSSTHNVSSHGNDESYTAIGLPSGVNTQVNQAALQLRESCPLSRDLSRFPIIGMLWYQGLSAHGQHTPTVVWG